MAARSSLSQVVQVGVEATPGVTVACTRRLTSVSIEPTPKANVDVFTPTSYKYPTLAALTKEWSEAGLSGRATYTELPYLLSSVVTAPVVTQPDAVNAPDLYKWVFTPKSTGADAPKTFSIERGDDTTAMGFSHAIVTEFGINFTRDSIEISGSMLGNKVSKSITLTPDAEEVPLVPMLTTGVTVYLDDTAEDLGTTVVENAITTSFNLGSRYNPFYALNASKGTGFSDIVESTPDATAGMLGVADAQILNLIDTLREGDTKFMRIEVLGEAIGNGTVPTNRFAFILDMAVKVTDHVQLGDNDDVFGGEWAFSLVHDREWGKPFQITIQNNIAAL